MAYNMANKNKSEYNHEEENVYNAVSKFSSNINEDLKLLGNFNAVREIFDSVVKEKEKILEEKSKSFIPTERANLLGSLNLFEEKASKKLVILLNNDRVQISEQRQAMERQINDIKAQIISIFGEWNSKLESEKVKALTEMRAASKEYYSIDERTGTKTHANKYRVSTSVWYKPSTWGTSKTEYSTYEETYTYLSASDAADNLRNFVLDSTNYIERIFNEAVSHREMKRKLLNVVTSNFQLGDEKYDPALFRIMVENAINKIEFPIVKIDSSSAIDKLTAEFSGEITSYSEKNNLRNALSKSIEHYFSIMTDEFEKSVKNFKSGLGSIQVNIEHDLLENINAEFDEVMEKFNNKEKEAENYKEYINRLKATKNSL